MEAGSGASKSMSRSQLSSPSSASRNSAIFVASAVRVDLTRPTAPIATAPIAPMRWRKLTAAAAASTAAHCRTRRALNTWYVPCHARTHAGGVWYAAPQRDQPHCARLHRGPRLEQMRRTAHVAERSVPCVLAVGVRRQTNTPRPDGRGSEYSGALWLRPPACLSDCAERERRRSDCCGANGIRCSTRVRFVLEYGRVPCGL